MNTYFYIALGIWNIAAFGVMGYDKFQAKKGRRRVPELYLFFMSFVLGGIGIFLGMRYFRHKTRHQSFRILVPISVILNIAILEYVDRILF